MELVKTLVAYSQQSKSVAQLVNPQRARYLKTS